MDLRGKNPQMLISFFGLIGTCVGVRLRAPIRENNRDLEWLKIQPVDHNQ